MRRVILAALGLVCLMATTACTTTMNAGKPPASGVASGFTYQLPIVTYSLEIARELRSCPTAGDQGGVQFSVTAKAVASAGPGETVLIDYASLANYLKTTDISFENHPNGLLKSVNAQVDDRTAAVVKAGVDAAVAIGKLAIDLGSSSAFTESTQKARPSFVSCTPSAATALAGLPALKDGVTEAAKKQKAAQEEYDSFATANPTPPDAGTAVELEKRAAALRVAKAGSVEANGKLAKALASITLVTRLNYAPGSTPVELALPDSLDGDAKLESVMGITVRDADPKKSIFVPLSRDAAPDVARAVIPAKVDPLSEEEKKALVGLTNPLKKADVVIVAKPLVTASAPLTEGAACAGGECGIIYRTPAPARMQICVRSEKEDGAPNHDVCWARLKSEPGVIFSDERGIPQLGTLASLPLKNRTFESNHLTAEFSADGVLTKFGYKKPIAGGEAMANSARDAAVGISTLVQYDRESDLRALQSDKALSDAEFAAREARAKLQQPSAVTTTDNETALLQAEKRRIDAAIALEKAKAELAALKAASSPD
jgi:hypothetical protein